MSDNGVNVTADITDLITGYNTIFNWQTVKKGNEITTVVHRYPIVTDEGNTEERIIAQFTDAYKKYSVAYLGYNEYIDPMDYYTIISNDSIEEEDGRPMTMDQILNSQFMVSLGKNGRIKSYFNMNRFRNRPIFCGVNVLYDPVLTEDFKKSRKTVDYFEAPWDSTYERSKYNDPKSKDAVSCRDLSFCPTYLSEMQNEAGYKDSDKPPLVFAMIKRGFSLGVSALRPTELAPNSGSPSQYSRVYGISDNCPKDYGIILPYAEVRREIPTTNENLQQITTGPNNAVYQLIPPVLDTESTTPKILNEGKVISDTVGYPSVIFAGETIPGYDMVSYLAVPICSWSYFISERSGYAGTKAVSRLESTGACGPFVRVKANGYYNSTLARIMESNCTIVLEKYTYEVEEDGKKKTKTDLRSIDIRLKNNKGEVVWGPYYGGTEEQRGAGVGSALKNACLEMLGLIASDKKTNKDKYPSDKDVFINKLVTLKDIENDNQTTNITFKISVLRYPEETYRDELALDLYNNAYVRDDSDNPGFINDMFKEVQLPLRFSFFVIGNDLNKIYINQYPCIPVVNPRTMTEDYITQLMPLYQKAVKKQKPKIDEEGNEEVDDEVKEEVVEFKEEVKTWYLNPNDILVGGISASFYNVNTQKATVVDYPSNPEDRTGQMYICTGYVYRGPEVDESETRISGLPDSIKVINLSDPGETPSYINTPITIAPNQQLTYMNVTTSGDFSNQSRKAYIEYIKNGCVFSDSPIGKGFAPEPSTIEEEYTSKERNPVFAKYIEIISKKPTKGTDPNDIEKITKAETPGWAIAVVVVSAIVLVLLIGFVIWFLIKNRGNDWCTVMKSDKPKNEDKPKKDDKSEPPQDEKPLLENNPEEKP
jgi:hypothetical protein